MVAEGGAIEAGLGTGLELPAGATVADLVSALAARGLLPRRSSPALPTPPVTPPHPSPAKPAVAIAGSSSEAMRSLVRSVPVWEPTPERVQVPTPEPLPSEPLPPEPLPPMQVQVPPVLPVQVPEPVRHRRSVRPGTGVVDGCEVAVGRIPQPRHGIDPIRRPAPDAVEPLTHAARPPIGEEPAILGLSRLSRGRVGSRAFNLLFALVFGVIFLQLVFTLLMP